MASTSVPHNVMSQATVLENLQEVVDYIESRLIAALSIFGNLAPSLEAEEAWIIQHLDKELVR